MTRRHRILAISGLAACFLSGCWRGLTDQSEGPSGSPLPSARTVTSVGPEGAALPQPRSDYQVQLVPPTRREGRPPDPVELVRHEAKPPTPPPADKPPTPASSPAPPQPAPDVPLIAALRSILEKRPPEEALHLLRARDKRDRELVFALLQISAALDTGDLGCASPQRVLALLDQVQARVLPPKPRGLTLDKACFCSRPPEGFGVYDPLSPDHCFQAGVDGQPGELVQVYVEVSNFISRQRGPYHEITYHEITLAGRLEILNFRGELAAPPIESPPCTDRSQSLRHDCFVNFQFPVPSRLPPGDYTLRIQVRDAGGTTDGKPSAPQAASCSLDFRVTGTGSARAAPAVPGETTLR